LLLYLVFWIAVTDKHRRCKINDINRIDRKVMLQDWKANPEIPKQDTNTSWRETTWQRGYHTALDFEIEEIRILEYKLPPFPRLNVPSPLEQHAHHIRFGPQQRLGIVVTVWGLETWVSYASVLYENDTLFSMTCNHLILKAQPLASMCSGPSYEQPSASITLLPNRMQMQIPKQPM
jgi:hypothetical protein